MGEWLDIWAKNYLGAVKPFTAVSYKGQIKNHIMPALGAVRLETLNAHTIQGFYNQLGEGGLSAKTVKNIHGVLHKSLQQAVMIGYIRFNPSDACTLPRTERRELKPLDEEQSRAFLTAIKGHRFEALFAMTLVTGLREGEALGHLWACVDFERGTILVDKQLQREKKKKGRYIFAPLKNDKARLITPAPWVMQVLRSHRAGQIEQRFKVASCRRTAAWCSLMSWGGTWPYIRYTKISRPQWRLLAALTHVSTTSGTATPLPPSTPGMI